MDIGSFRLEKYHMRYIRRNNFSSEIAARLFPVIPRDGIRLNISSK